MERQGVGRGKRRGGEEGAREVNHILLFTSATQLVSYTVVNGNKGLLHGYEWGLRFGGLELRFG